jgi:ribonuclease HII
LAKRLESRRTSGPARERASRKGGGAASRARASLDTYRRLAAFDSLAAGSGDRVRVIAGVDEAGRGALAGPVVAAAVILPPDPGIIGVDDSKRLPERRREELFDEIVTAANAVAISFGHPPLIDERNILQATLMTMHRAVSRLGVRPDLVLVDGRDVIHWDGPVMAIVKGDATSLAIAAASVVAKVARDRMMRKLHRRFPHYNFVRNKGYGSREHLEAILEHGTAPPHRRTFRPKVVETGGDFFY